MALKQLQIILRDGLVDCSERVGRYLRRQLEANVLPFDIIGDIRGLGLYRMLDVVTDKQTKTPNPESAERIRYNLMMWS